MARPAGSSFQAASASRTRAITVSGRVVISFQVVRTTVTI
jgi:hypothetical protein